jgi:hypothetical protein
MKLLELFEQSGKTAAVAFGRMNPPTIGHQKVVDAILKQKADAHFLFVSQTHKPTGKNKTRYENPLPFDVKLGFIQQAFPNIDIGDTSVGTAIGILQNLEKQGFENVIFVCGSDRVPSFTELFNKQNGIDYNLKSIKIVSSGGRDPDAEGAEGMSASKMRAAAIADDFESFKTGLPAGLGSDAEEVFAAVRQGLEPWLEQEEVKEASLGEVLPWPEVANKISSAMKAMGWKAQRKGDDAFLFSTKGAEDESQYYMVMIDNEGNGMFTYALGTWEGDRPDIGEQDTLPTTAASVSEVLMAIRDGYGLD